MFISVSKFFDKGLCDNKSQLLGIKIRKIKWFERLLHFIYIVDIIGALFIYQKEKRLNPQNMSSTISK